MSGACSKVIASVALDGATLTVYEDRHLSLTLPDRRHFVAPVGAMPKYRMTEALMADHLRSTLVDALAANTDSGHPRGFRFSGMLRRGHKIQGPRATNRRPVVTAALSAVAGYQIEGAGHDDEGEYLDVRLGLAPTVRIHLVGLTDIELEELSK